MDEPRQPFSRCGLVGGNFEGALGARSECIVNKSPCFATAESAVQLLQSSVAPKDGH
jgi:hypothetical protein